VSIKIYIILKIIKYYSKNYSFSTRFFKSIYLNLLKKKKRNQNLHKRNSKFLLTSVSGKNIFITHKLLLIIVDNKICNILTDTNSSIKCYICNIHFFKQINDINSAKNRTIKIKHYSFELSSLHC